MRDHRQRSGAPWMSFVSVGVFLALWEALDRLDWINPVFFSSPTRIIRSAVDLLGSGRLNEDIQVTLLGFFFALGVATGLGVLVGISVGLSDILYRLFDPIIVALNALPKIVLMPLVILWFGLGLSSKVFLGSVMAGFPIVVGTHAGVRNLERDHVQLARAFGASPLRIFHLVVLPSIAPFVLAGVRLGINYAMVGVLIVEFFASGKGIGYRMVLYTQNFQIDAFFVLLGLVVAFVLTCSGLVRRLENRMGRWRPVAT